MRYEQYLLRVLVVLAAFLAGPCLAQQYPNKPIRIIVPFSPGGNIDVTSRIIAEPMSRSLGQQILIDNKAGAGGSVGAEFVARADPDGYTLLSSAAGTLVINPKMLAKLPYTLDSFMPIGLVALAPMLVVVRTESPLKDFAGFLAAARANPGKLIVGHSGNGTSNHVTLLQLQSTTGISVNMIPYKGSGPAILDLMGGQIEASVDQTSSALTQIRAGKLRALAVSTKTRSKQLPDVPPMAEQGVKDFDSVTASGLYAPLKTPVEVLARINKALNEALADPTVQKRMTELSLDTKQTTIDEFTAILKNEDAVAKSLAQKGLLKVE